MFRNGLILTDEIAIDPILDFNLYRNAIVSIIKNLPPKFTIGIFGEWGAGKTTLINSVDTAVQADGNLIRVKLEAWRYTQEQFPLVSLLKNIAYALPAEKQFEVLKQKLVTSSINFLKNTPEILTEGEKDDDDMKVWKVLHDFKTDSDLWNFLGQNSDTLKNIRDWNMYRNVIDVTVEPTTLYRKTINYEAVKLLQSGKISEFNDKRTIELRCYL